MPLVVVGRPLIVTIGRQTIAEVRYWAWILDLSIRYRLDVASFQNVPAFFCRTG